VPGSCAVEGTDFECPDASAKGFRARKIA